MASEQLNGTETQLFVASTVYGLATVVAALEDGLFPPARERILLLSNNSANPEAANPLSAVEGFELLIKNFDRVFCYNDAVAPQHPSEWMPRAVDLPILDRYFRTCWQIQDDPLRLVVESIHVRPAAALCQVFHDAIVDVYADGLMSYGPTRSALPALVGTRVGRLLHLDLVSGLRPLLLSEWAVEQKVISGSSFRRVLGHVAANAEVSVAGNEPVALLLGQYLSALGILTEAEEADLHLDMLRAAVAVGARRVVFKPHPSAGRDLAEPMIAAAEPLGVELHVYSDPVLAETLYERLDVELVVGCFSTAMLTATSCYKIQTVRVGTELLLERLRPYENSNRIPVTIVDAVVPGVAELTGERNSDASVELNQLVQAVGYCMQPRTYPELRGVAEGLLAERYPSVGRYFKRRRLAVLDLPGKLVSRDASPRPRHSRARTWARRRLRSKLPSGLVCAARRVGRGRRNP